MSNAAFSLGVGLHDGVTAAAYHADPCATPSLSSGLARTILNRSIAHAYMEHPKLGGAKRASTKAMDVGSIVHSLMAGGDDYELGTYDNYRSAAAQAWRASVEASGKTPVLERDLDHARPIVEALKSKADLGCTNSPFVAHGKSEVTGIWKEGDTYCRFRADRLVIDPTGFADIWDWKKTQDCSEREISRTIASMGYHIQAAFYLRGLAALLPGYSHRLSFILVFVEELAPYTVRRVCLSAEFMALANIQVDRAIKQWQSALATGEWSDASTETLTIEPPMWLADQLDIEIS